MMSNQEKINFIKNHIGKFNDFPKPGVVFRDLFTALADGRVCVYLKDLILSHVKENFPDVDVIVGLESRGFLFCFLVAAELGIPCVPIRKKGKLPGKCLGVQYDLEYGTDEFEIQEGTIKPGKKVLIIDDLLATGGSLEAAIKLIKKCEVNIFKVFVVIELISLNGRQRLDCDINSLISYN